MQPVGHLYIMTQKRETMLQFIIFLLSSTFALLVNATPVCRDAMILSGGDVPNTDLPTTVSEEGIREIQLAQFLENLEVSFFCAGLANITDWGANGYSNDSIEIVGKIAAVRILLPYPQKIKPADANASLARGDPSPVSA